MSLNSVLDFIFQAMKKDSQLANLLVKTTKLMPAVFDVLKLTVNNVQSENKQMLGLALITLDKCTKLMHLALLHPRDHTLSLLHELIDNQHAAAPGPDPTTGWALILKMF
jgi:hypothetical protein